MSSAGSERWTPVIHQWQWCVFFPDTFSKVLEFSHFTTRPELLGKKAQRPDMMYCRNHTHAPKKLLLHKGKKTERVASLIGLITTATKKRPHNGQQIFTFTRAKQKTYQTYQNSCLNGYYWLKVWWMEFRLTRINLEEHFIIKSSTSSQKDLLGTYKKAKLSDCHWSLYCTSFKYNIIMNLKTQISPSNDLKNCTYSTFWPGTWFRFC